MKPELIIQDFGGVNNQALEKTTARLLKGGSWKKQRIVVVIPAADTIAAKVVLSWMNLAFPPNNGLCRILAQGMEVGDAYSSAIEQILVHPDLSKWEYLLTMEHDNAPQADALVRLVERMEEHPEFACIGGLYFTKGITGVAQIWGDIKDPLPNYRPMPPDPDGGLVECYGTGMGFNLWRLKIFKDKKLAKPWFKTLNGKDGKGVATQDLMFWAEARKYGYRCAIDCSARVGHYDQSGVYGEADTMY